MHGNISFSSGTSGPLGPFSKLVVRTVGSLKYCAQAARASTLFLNSPGEKSCTSEIRPDWWSTSRHAASFLDSRVYLNDWLIMTPPMVCPPEADQNFRTR